MSTTSTSFTRHRRRRGGQRESEGRYGHEDHRRRSSDQFTRSRDLYTEESWELHPENAKWSSEKLKEELSSLIAEFSYVTDTSNKIQNTNATPNNQSNANAPRPRQSFQVYTAGREKMGTPFENPEFRKKGVEWEDQRRGTVAYNVQGATYCEVPQRARVIKRGRFRRSPKVRVRKSRSVRSCNSRDLSCPRKKNSVRKVRRRFSGFRASKSRCRARRTRSCRSRSVTPMRRRVVSRLGRRTRTPSCSRSTVRDMPFKVRHKRSREVVIKKSTPKIAFKAIEPCAEPTVVTLFPKTVRRRISRADLPCKCTMCNQKYRALARLCEDPCFFPCAPQCTPICDPCSPTCAPCPPICAPCPQICYPRCQMVRRGCSPCYPNWNCNTGGGMCNRPWGNPCYMGDCCQPQPLAGRCFKSVCFKFGGVGQNLNSNITQYFHSILDRGVCC